MAANATFIATLVLFDGAAVAWAAWEFWLSRPRKDAVAEADPPSTDASRHAEREHGLDDGRA
jgi:hypothetical protein